jgi:hypothetical protein
MVVEPLGSGGRAVELLGTKWIGKVLSNEHGRKECLIEPADGRVTPLYTDRGESLAECDTGGAAWV